MTRLLSTALSALALLLLPCAAVAQTQAAQTQASSPVQVTLIRLLVGKDAGGKETLKALSNDNTRPGEVLAWQASAQNNLDRSLSGLRLNVPIPASTVYVADSARMVVNGQAVTPLFSLDGKTFAPAPLKKKVQVTRDGVTSTQEVVVQPNEYRAVQFLVPVLAAGSSVQAEVRTTVQ